MTLPAFDFHAPTTVADAIALLAEHGDDARLMAGGTDLLLALEGGKVACRHVISLRRVRELDTIAFDRTQGLTVGAGTTVASVARHPAVREHYPVLVDAIEQLATVQVRHKATVGGNLCNAAPCANTAPPLMALGARMSIVGPDGRREVALEHFITGPGQTVLTTGELVDAITVPPVPSEMRTIFLQHSSRSKVDIAAVNVAIALRQQGDVVEEVHIFLGSVAPTPMRATAAEKHLRGREATAERIREAAEAARTESQPITDVRATESYRRHMVGVLTKRALMSLTGLT